MTRAGMQFQNAFAGFFHYIRVGPNETDDADEARAADEKAKTSSVAEKKP